MDEEAALLQAYRNPSKTHTEQDHNDNIDYFGVIHENGIPKKSRKTYEKIRHTDTKREKKWLKMPPNNNFHPLFRDSLNGKLPEKVILRIYKGIPHTLRGTIWPLLLGVSHVRENHPGVYQDMLEAAHSYSSYIRQIHLDVQRTFRQTAIYYDNYSIRMCSLFNVLLAYSVYNAEVGYTQGMNEVAGFLLMHFPDEEDVFWALSQLLCGSKWNLFGCFIPNFPKMFRFFKHLESIIQRFLPKLHRHFERCGIRVDIYATKGYLLCFLDRLPLSLCYRLWDLFLLEGEIILHAMFYNILKMHKRRLLRMDEMQAYDWLMTTLSENFSYADDAAIDSLKACVEDLRRAHMDRVTPSTLENGELPTKPFGFLVQEGQKAEAEKKKLQQSNITLTKKSKKLKNATKPAVTVLKKPKARIETLNDIGSKSNHAVPSENQSPVAMDGKLSLHILRSYPPEPNDTINVISSNKTSTNPPPLPFPVSKNERVISHSVYTLYRSSSEFDNIPLTTQAKTSQTPAPSNTRREWFVASPPDKCTKNNSSQFTNVTTEGETKL